MFLKRPASEQTTSARELGREASKKFGLNETPAEDLPKAVIAYANWYGVKEVDLKEFAIGVRDWIDCYTKKQREDEETRARLLAIVHEVLGE